MTLPVSLTESTIGAIGYPWTSSSAGVYDERLNCPSSGEDLISRRPKATAPSVDTLTELLCGSNLVNYGILPQHGVSEPLEITSLAAARPPRGSNVHDHPRPAVLLE